MKIFSKTKIFLVIVFIVFTFFTFEKIKAGVQHNVSGWAWSENIGWISFNNTSGGGATDYGVHVNTTSTGVFSGYAWSENIGWIDFAPASPYPTAPSYSACLDLPGAGQVCDGVGDQQISGWARALNYGDGWDGWIKLRGVAQDATPYGVSRNTSTNELEGWAFADTVIGWISFNCNNPESGSVCLTSDYQVILFGGDTTGPDVSVIADPPSVTTTWQNTNATATVACSDTGTGCDAGSYRLTIYSSDPGTCSTDYATYTLSSPQTISSNVWICGAAKDLGGNAGFSNVSSIPPAPVEFLVDQTEPNSQIQSPSSGGWYSDDFTLDTLDEDLDSGLDTAQCQYKIVPYEDTTGNGIADTERPSSGWLSRTCDAPPNSPATTITVGTTDYCQYEATNACYVYLRSQDIAGNIHSPAEAKGSIKYYHIDWTAPVPGKLYITATQAGQTYPIAVDEGVEYTFKSDVTDNVKITACDLYIDGIRQGAMDVSPTCDTGCTVSTTTITFDTAGPFSNNYARCIDAGGNVASGESADITVAANSPPIITSGPAYTTTPPSGGTPGIDYCTSPTTQFGCDIYFSVTSTDSDGDTLFYNWTFGDGGSSSEQNPVYYYSVASDPGSYDVSVIVFDGRGGIDTGSLPITVSDPTLYVDACAGLDAGLACYDAPTFSNPANGVDLQASVTGTMYGTINYKFDCTNDGAWELEPPSQTTEIYTAVDLCNYSGVSSYTAKVLVQRGAGSNQDVVSINLIENTAPSLNWTGESGYITDGLEPETGNSSANFVYRIKYTDPEGDAPNFVRVHVKKGGLELGGPFDVNYVSGTYIGGAIYSYATSTLVGGSDYTYFFEAQDNKGLGAPPTSELSGPDVNNSPSAQIACEIIDCKGPGCQCNGSWITYNGTGVNYRINNLSTDPDNNITKSTWSIVGWQDPWYECNDNLGTPAENEALCFMTFPQLFSGAYTVKLKVEDGGVLTDTTTYPITVKQDAVADFECSLNPAGPWQNCNGFRVSESELVYFNNLSSAPDGGSPITTWIWTFEDGTPASSSLQNPSASFAKVDAGSGRVTLEIVDSVGRSDPDNVSYQLQTTTPLPEWREVPPL